MMYNGETKEIAKPSELLNSIKAIMNVLQSIENYGMNIRQLWHCTEYSSRGVKIRGMGLMYCENCIIRTSTISNWTTHVAYLQMDGWVIAYSMLCIYAVAH